MAEHGSGSIEVRRPDLPVGRFRHAVLDFDGTLSVIREGWERVMVPLMVEMIVGTEGDADGAVRRLVERYVDESTGVQTILQMEWLAKTVAERRGVAQALSPQEYRSSMIALSRAGLNVSPFGVSTREKTSSIVRNFGRFFGTFGLDTSFAWFDFTYPSL